MSFIGDVGVKQYTVDLEQDPCGTKTIDATCHITYKIQYIAVLATPNSLDCLTTLISASFYDCFTTFKVFISPPCLYFIPCTQLPIITVVEWIVHFVY